MSEEVRYDLADQAEVIEGVASAAPDAPVLQDGLGCHAGAGAMVVTDREGRPIAVAREVAVSAVPLERRPWVPVSSVSADLDPQATLSADLAGESLLDAMTAHPATDYLVVEPDGSLVGVLMTADVESALSR